MVEPHPLKDILDTLHSKAPLDVALVSNAYAFSINAHKDQKRYSGDPYTVHTTEVGLTLAEAGLDARTVAAGLLHDTIEDAGVGPREIEEQFGAEVRQLVEGVTKLGALKYRGLERHTESLRNLFAATAKDIRVLVIKLFDRLHNARTLSHVPNPDKRKRIALETLEIYAPIADRLGMSVLKQDLEDAAFPYGYPAEYERTMALLKERKHENDKRLEKTERVLKRELGESGLRNFRMEKRIKGLYSLFRKLERKDWDITKIYDIIALRIIFPSAADCYTALGIIHAHWRPVPGKIKDYMAFPKPNGYQSIHTTVYTGDGGALEIQLRTEGQHLEAQYGIASHLSYKEVQRGIPSSASGFRWVRQFFPSRNTIQTDAASKDTTGAETVPQWLVELAKTTHGAEGSAEYLDTLKSDFFSHRIFVFTPRGDVIDLPVAATPIDFAFAVHSDLGSTMSGAKVNGKMVSLDSELKNGDMVEILNRPTGRPNRKWLEYAKTNMAKKHIRAALSLREKEGRTF